MNEVRFVFEINRRDRTVTLSREFAGFREKTVPWDAARLSDGRSFDDWEPADCTPVEILQPEPMNAAQWQAAAIELLQDAANYMPAEGSEICGQIDALIARAPKDTG